MADAPEIYGRPSDGESDHGEAELADALEKAARRTLRTRIADSINRPLLFWLVTTMTAGCFAFIFSNYNGCRADRNADNDRLGRLALEIGGREIALITLMINRPLDGESMNSLKGVKEVAEKWIVSGPIFSEYKYDTPIGLQSEVRRLLHKWKQTPSLSRKTRR